MKPQIKKIYDVEMFNIINSKVIEWDYRLVVGESLYSRTEKYAHIGIKIYPSDSYTNEIIWNVDETDIPESFFPEIETVISFFSNYLTSLKGKREPALNFEVFEGSFTPDSYRNAFAYATIRALINCFDKSIFSIAENQKDRIKNNKANAITILKHSARK